MDAPPKPKIRVRLKPKSPPTDAAGLQRAVEATLREKVRESIHGNMTGGLFMGGLALVVAVVTYWVAFALLTFGTGWLFTLPYWLKRLASAGVVIGAYVFHARHHVEQWSELQVETGDGKPPFAISYAPAGLLANVALLSPETRKGPVRLMAAVWLFGPQLVWAGWRNLQRAARLRRLDITGCAGIISMMMGKSKTVSFVEIIAACPHLDVSGLAGQLLELEGVVLLREEPAGLTLTPDWRQDFLAGCGLGG